MAGGEVAGREPRNFRHLLLAVAGIEERAPKRRRRKAEVVRARQARRRHVEVAVEVDRERAMDRGAQAERLGLEGSAAIRRARDESKGRGGVAEAVVRAFP